MPDEESEKQSLYGNFSQPIYKVSNASEPSVRCSNKSSSLSASFSPDLSLRKPLRPRLTPADWIARIRSSLLVRLKNGTRRCVSTDPHILASSRLMVVWSKICLSMQHSQYHSGRQSHSPEHQHRVSLTGVKCFAANIQYQSVA